MNPQTREYWHLAELLRQQNGELERMLAAARDSPMKSPEHS